VQISVFHGYFPVGQFISLFLDVWDSFPTFSAFAIYQRESSMTPESTFPVLSYSWIIVVSGIPAHPLSALDHVSLTRQLNGTNVLNSFFTVLCRLLESSNLWSLGTVQMIGFEICWVLSSLVFVTCSNCS
jgi:hypothetical protein